ncbi:LOW QUALITY PROTEIN: testis-expressed protein 36 [Sceloporus undulatus]|uniref:LOW QUALITY PROTEIN: testis-expressed protein 36 n=1 Tax=Sceloporus undulatus TaxID=8520 RepID=UPI001C4D4467|nr:LOW QUALITY PROTEIN: testis-expressed protein 36 [Sceloporus undulatus]
MKTSNIPRISYSHYAKTDIKSRSNSQIDNRLPQMYKVREKKPVNTFPFSIHDNRHCLLNVGEYLDSGLGLKKFQQETCQQHSQNYFFLAHEPMNCTSQRTIYQTSFIQYPNIKPPLVGRFPKSHVEKSILKSALKSETEKECMWFAKGYADSNNLPSVKPEKSSVSGPEQPLPAEQVTECKEYSKEITV